MNPDDVRALCTDLAIQRRSLARHKNADAAIRVQNSKAALNDAARELRVGFRLITNKRLTRT